MDLFVINRYKDDGETSASQVQEAANLQKLKQRIEERRKANLAKKGPEKSEITLKVQNEEALEAATAVSQPQDETLKVFAAEDKSEVPQAKLSTKESKAGKLSTEFQVLGIKEFEKKAKVRRVLPYWLSHPVCVPTSLQDLSSHVDTENWLHPVLRKTLLAEGISHLFPVQKSVVPYIVKAHENTGLFWPNDVCVSAPTGSGKTLAFVLPIVQVLIEQREHGTVGALVVVPVQELAQQVAKVFRKYCSHTVLKVALLSVATPLHQEQKQLVRHTESRGYVSEVDIVVCTAGRLVEHLRSTPGFDLRSLLFLVIDEADRVMDNIQNDWLYHLNRHINLDSELMTGKMPMLSWKSLTTQKRPPHKLLFSATLSQDPEKLEQWGLFQPKLFSASNQTPQENEDDDDAIRKYTTPDELTEKCIVCEAEQKPLALHHLVRARRWRRVLCFANAAQTAHRLAALLSRIGDLRVAEMSAALERRARETVLKKFHAGEIDVLISTDALARGIDVPLCDYVVSYDPPKNIRTYVHRVGRTGRAGRPGVAVTMLLPAQTALFKTLLNSGGKSSLPTIEIPEHVYDEYADEYERAVAETRTQVHQEMRSRVKRSIALKRGFRNKGGQKTAAGAKKSKKVSKSEAQ